MSKGFVEPMYIQRVGVFSDALEDKHVEELQSHFKSSKAVVAHKLQHK